MTVSELICFGSAPGQGNAALVVERFDPSPVARQLFASARGRPACAFLDAGNDAQAPYVVDFYTPHKRSPLCLHAALACARLLLARHPELSRIGVKTRLRGQVLLLSKGEGGYRVALTPQPLAPVAISADLPARMLSVPGLQLASKPALASVGSPKLLLRINGRAALAALRPNLALISEWGREHGINGVYAYCALGANRFEGRNFNHLDPAMEDAATGVAAGALTALLGQGLTLYQGAALGQPCEIRTSIEGEKILIGGAVEAVPALTSAETGAHSCG
jgi:PhzF family phenazine biosynthesis protein